jgi:hypothetical protein
MWGDFPPFGCLFSRIYSLKQLGVVSNLAAKVNPVDDSLSTPKFSLSIVIPIFMPFLGTPSLFFESPSSRYSGRNPIYVQIPAYRDSELSKTLLSLYRKAAQPQRIRTAVLWQYGTEEQLDARVLRLPNLRIFRIPASESPGCNWARNYLQRQWQGEPYTLLLDSHHRFVQNWDKTVIRMYKTLKSDGVKKPIVTAYLPPYHSEREPHGRLRDIRKIYPHAYERGLLTHLTSNPVVFWEKLSKPLKADFISLHFLFTDGKFNREILADPEVYFFGDEVVTSLRAFIRGYDFFHPHRILGWHQYERTARVTHWDDHSNWRKLTARSHKRIKNIYRGRSGVRNRAIDIRSRKDYEAHIHLKLIQ